MDFTIVSSTKPRKPLKEHCLLRSHYLLECLSCFRVDTKGPTLGPDWPKCLFPFRPLRPLFWLITPSSVFGASLSCLRVVSLLQFQSTSAPSAIFLTRLPLKFCSLVKSDHSWPSLSLSAPSVPTEPRHLSPIMKSSGLHNWGVGWLMSSQVAHSTSNFSALSSSRPPKCSPQKLPCPKSSLEKLPPQIFPVRKYSILHLIPSQKLPCPKSSPPDPKQYIGPRCVSKSRSPSSSMVVLLSKRLHNKQTKVPFFQVFLSSKFFWGSHSSRIVTSSKYRVAYI